jgi:phospholipid/cholesterol/gamma-HCH transport system substrate-binding protein
MSEQPHKEASASTLPSIPHAELKAGGLLLATLLLILAFVIYVMNARGVFDDNQRLLLLAENSEGVVVGTDLTFSGFPIGRVIRIELGDDGKAHIHIDVPLHEARWLRTSSVFTLERGVVGGAKLRAYSGILEDPPLEDGARRDVLIGDATSGIPELVATMHKLVGNLERLSSDDAPLSASLANVERFTAALNGKNGALGALLGNEKNVAKLIRTLEESRMLLTDARNSLQKLDTSLEDVKAITGNVRDASGDLDQLRAEIDLNLRKISGLVDDLNRKWPFARDRELKLP